MGFCSSSYSNITLYKSDINNTTSKHIKYVDKLDKKLLSNQSLIIDIPNNIDNKLVIDAVHYKLPILRITSDNNEKVRIITHIPDKSFADFINNVEDTIIYNNNQAYSLMVSSLVIVQIIKYLQNQQMYDIKISNLSNIEINSLREPNEIYMNMYKSEFNTNICTYPDSFTEWTKIKIIQDRDDCYTYDDLLEILEGDYKIPRVYIESIYILEYNILYRINNKMLQNRIDILYDKYKINETDNLYMNLIAFNNMTPIITPTISFTKKEK